MISIAQILAEHGRRARIGAPNHKAADIAEQATIENKRHELEAGIAYMPTTSYAGDITNERGTK